MKVQNSMDASVMLPEEKVWHDEKACQVIDDLLDYIKDGEWHGTRELMTLISPTKLEKTLTFLEKYRFIKWDKKTAHVKLDYAALNFLQNLFQASKHWKKRATH